MIPSRVTAHTADARPGWPRTLIYIAWVLLMACFFAEVEIQIEGAAGWAANLPTWRIESHWLLDIFWGGRPMTGYHAWVFSFMVLTFFSPLVFFARYTVRAVAQAVAGVMLFWMSEDALWFFFNPAYGWSHFAPQYIAWHKHWLLGMPNDYWFGFGLAAVLFVWINRRRPWFFNKLAPGDSHGEANA